MMEHALGSGFRHDIIGESACRNQGRRMIVEKSELIGVFTSDAQRD